MLLHFPDISHSAAVFMRLTTAFKSTEFTHNYSKTSADPYCVFVRTQAASGSELLPCDQRCRSYSTETLGWALQRLQRHLLLFWEAERTMPLAGQNNTPKILKAAFHFFFFTRALTGIVQPKVIMPSKLVWFSFLHQTQKIFSRSSFPNMASQ